MSAVLSPPRRAKPKTPRGFVGVAPAGELTDPQWAAVAPLLPVGRSTGRRRSTDLRRIVTAIDHHWRTGCPWRKLPPGFPPWSTVYSYFRQWHKDGTLRKLRAILDPPKLSAVRPQARKVIRPPARLDPDRKPSPVRLSYALPKPR